MRVHHRATSTPTATVGVDAGTTPQQKRRALFASLLAAVFLPALVAALLPDAQAQETVFVAADVADAPPASESPTSATPAPTTAAPTTAVPSTAAPSTTGKPKSTTTTTKPKSTTTTAAPKAAARAAAPAPAPVAAPAPPPAPAGAGPTPAEASFLACVRQRESGGNYGVVSANGLWYGAYQMTRQTWNSAAQRAGRPDLVGVPPNQASPSDQDYVALVLYRWLGKSPWGGVC